MQREIKLTKDGAKTLYISGLNESYHSTHGALQEAKHVFIENGLKLLNSCNINILELGFGTGLNVLATFDEYLKSDKNHIIRYFSVEKYPVSSSEINELDYPSQFPDERIATFNEKIHQTDWNKEIEVYSGFFLMKIKADFFQIENLSLPEIDLVYFDCFGARVQPDLWEKPLFEVVANKMKEGGLLTTYSSKGSVRRILAELGFEVQKKPGPPGKREMINAFKNL